MATINYRFCEEKLLYDSGNIEQEMLKAYKRGREPQGPDTFYSTSPIRENIINWYPFKKDSIILEIGGGLGSITGVLCKRAKKVVSCEYSKRRAENIYYRHKKNSNLEVIVGNINKIELEEQVDYIVLIGVFEYSKRFFNSENPFSEFLKLLKTFLKPDGVILIAIENRYGIKYWAGATEDHYEVKYLGLKNYDCYDIQTFGKKELSDIIEKEKFVCKFYYPYPDYKMPYIIFTDQRLPLKSELSTLQIYNHGNQVYNFDYREILAGLIDNNQYGFFANSFLVEISNKKKNLSNTIYAKSSWIRSEKYQNITRFDNQNKIIKMPKSLEGADHLNLLCQTHKKLAELGVNVSKVKKKGGSYQIGFIEGISLTEYIYNLARDGKKEEILEEIENFHKLLYSFSYVGPIKKFTGKKARNYFKKRPIDLLKLGLIDLHMGNIIKSKDKLYIIDQEWLVDYDLPVNYIIYFSTIMLFAWVPELQRLLNQEELLRQYGITKEEEEIYLEMSSYFSKKVLNNVDTKVQKHFIDKSNVYLIDEEVKDLTAERLSLQEKFSSTNSELVSTKEELVSTKEEIEKAREELVVFKNRKAIKFADKIVHIKNIAKSFKRVFTHIFSKLSRLVYLIKHQGLILTLKNIFSTLRCKIKKEYK